MPDQKALRTRDGPIIVRVDRSLRLLYMNPAGLRFVGRPGEEILGKTIAELGMPSEPGVLWENHFRKAFETAEEEMFESSVPGPDGRRHFQATLVPEFGEDGKVEAVFGMLFDISGRKRAEEALRAHRTAALNIMEDAVEARRQAERANVALAASRDQIQSLIDNTPALVYAFDLDERFILANLALAALLKSSPDRMIGKKRTDFMPQDTAEWHEANDRRVIQEGRALEFEERGAFEGRGITFLTTKFPLRDGDGRIYAVAGISADITERKQAEDHLEEMVRRRTEEIQRKDDHIRRAQKMEALGTLAGGIAHDFNNALSTIMINTEMALLDLDEGARAGSSLPLVLQAVQRGRDLIKQIITFSRQREQERRPVRVSPIVKEALKFLRSSLPANVEIRQGTEERADIVSGDPSQIHQILVNLCGNAAYAMRETGGVLDVGLKAVEADTTMAAAHPDLRPGPYLRLTVGDTGVGMTPEVMERAFDPFYTTKAPGEGSGLGLSVVHGIVKSYGGDIIVYSEVGKGSTFNVFLPRVRGTREEESVSEGPPEDGQERVLLVDDEAPQLESFAAALRRLGYAVTALTDSRKALAGFRESSGAFDLVITDQTMPKMTGSQLAEAMLKIRPDLPIILVTGFSEVVNGERAKLVGIREFVFKPFSLRDISAAIRRVLAEPKPASKGATKPARKRHRPGA
jgi:PAS domain S-box-containing protein